MRTKVCCVLNILGISTMFVSFVSGAQDCVMAPTQSDCANYKYPHADANLGMLCMHMSSMTGCSLRKQCKSGGAKGPLCNSFSLLADVCRPSEGMEMMMGCHNYTKLCAKGSVVKECNTDEAFSALPTTMKAKQLTIETCNEMSMMDGCTSCTNKTCTDPLMSYADVCRSMPSMGECEAWKEFCKMAGGDAKAFCPGENAYCSGRGSVMWNGFGFYSGPMQPCIIFLFQGVIITESWQYILSIVGIIVSGILFQLLTIGRRIFARKCADRLAMFAPVEALLFMVQQSWSYGLMFLAMTYRLDYFISVVVGLGLGRLVVVLHKGLQPKDNDDVDMMADDTNTACCTNEAGDCVPRKRKNPKMNKSQAYGVGQNLQCFDNPLLGVSSSPVHIQKKLANVVTLRVSGMMCMANCGTTVIKALRGMEGVVSAQMQYEQKLVHVDTQLPAAELIETIEDAGFEAELVTGSENIAAF